MTAPEFRELFQSVSNWGRWDDDRGALNHLTPEQARRWEFLLSAAPLRIVGGTGSPLNPIAVF